MATKSTIQTFSPRIDPSIPHDVQRHLQLIYGTLNNHAVSFEALPKATNPQPINIQTFAPRIQSTIPPEITRHLQLIYGKLNNHGVAFTQLPKLNLGTPPPPPPTTAQTFSPRIEPTIPHDVQIHLQLIYQKLDNHTAAFEFYKAHSPAPQNG